MANIDNQQLIKTSKKPRHGCGVIEIESCPHNSSKVMIQQNSHGSERESLFLRSEVNHMYKSYPCGFLTPEYCSSGVCRWIYPITYGGGLVAGDQIDVRFSIGQRCCAAVCTQETTKVYHCSNGEMTSQTMDYTLKQDSLLCLLPDPLVCYKDAIFHQKQTFHLTPSSNLVLLDWILEGRTALGESWQFQRYCNSMEIYLSDKLVLRECNDLESTQLAVLSNCMGKFQVMGTCILLGSYLESLMDKMQEKYGCKKGFGENNPEKLVVSVSPLSYRVDGNQMNGCYLRFLATDLKTASVFIRDITSHLLPDLGADPFENKL